MGYITNGQKYINEPRYVNYTKETTLWGWGGWRGVGQRPQKKLDTSLTYRLHPD